MVFFNVIVNLNEMRLSWGLACVPRRPSSKFRLRPTLAIRVHLLELEKLSACETQLHELAILITRTYTQALFDKCGSRDTKSVEEA
jgi:hypothetical protein